jgi:membrane-associated phospholipid phosphatase
VRRSLVLFALLLLTQSAHADDRKPARVPLRENFPWFEIAGIGVLAAGNIVLKTYEYDLAADRGAPLIGDAPGFDKSISNALYQGPFASPFLLHTPELVMTEAGPVVYASLYGLDSLVLWVRGRSLSGAVNPDHKLFAFAESQFLVAVVNLGFKIGVGRERPFEALHRYGSDPGQAKTTLSFFSNQTSAAFALAVFGWRDFSDWLTSGPMQYCSPSRKLWLGRVLPGVVAFGAGTWDGYSRIVDQRHWFTDVVTGAFVGTALGYFTYAYHFDWEGNPKRRWASDHHLRVLPAAGGASLTGTF